MVRAGAILALAAAPALAREAGQPGALAGTLHGPAPATVSACFVPAQSCLGVILRAIGAARRQIRVQAYGFSSRPILRALAAAHDRGIDVAVILDKSDAPPIAADAAGDTGHGYDARRFRRRGHGADLLASDGVPVWIDDLPAIAHNKLILIDGHLVVGGSYNYTPSAERRNAENVTFIDSADVARWFLANWDSRRAVSRRFTPAPGALRAGTALAADLRCGEGCRR